MTIDDKDRQGEYEQADRLINGKEDRYCSRSYAAHRGKRDHPRHDQDDEEDADRC